MTSMSETQKAQIGEEIVRVRNIRPVISQEKVAEAAGISPNTVASVERGTARVIKVQAVLEALAQLGRPVQVVDAAERDATPAPVPEDPIEGLADVIVGMLRIAPAEERQWLQDNLWMLLTGKHEELAARLSGYRRVS